MLGYSLYKGVWIWKDNPRSELKLPISKCRKMLNDGGFLVRNVYDFDCAEQTGFWYVIKDSFNGIQDVPSKYRARVRKALDAFEIKMVTKEFLIQNGYEVHIKAIENYRVKADAPTYDDFKNRINSLDERYDLWGCIHKESGRLAAFAINCIVDDTVDYQTMKFHPDFLSKSHSSYGLIYEMNRYYLEEKKMLFVNDGARSITNHSDVQPFLIQKFKFRKAYCKLNLVYQPWLKALVCILFPFRKRIRVRKVSAILNQEAMARGLV